MMGDLKFDEGDLHSSSLALQWWDGERMPVYPPLKNGWKLKLMPAE